MHIIIQVPFAMQCAIITQSSTTPSTAWSSPAALCLVAIYFVVQVDGCCVTSNEHLLHVSAPKL